MNTAICVSRSHSIENKQEMSAQRWTAHQLAESIDALLGRTAALWSRCKATRMQTSARLVLL